jgi:CheY-like chemotaxis protein
MGRAEAPAPRSHRILIVDDNSDHTDSLAALLRMAGHDIATAYDAEDALARATAFRPTVVLLDIGMPRMNGYELARRIRLEPWGEAAILIALTGWGQADDRRRSREAGIDHHLTKPVEFPAIAKLLFGA